MTSNTDIKELLQVKDLKLGTAEQVLVEDVNFKLNKGQVLGVVGESGSGKSLVSLAIIDLLPNAVHKVSGEINFYQEQGPGQKKVAMIFQEPMTSLNPVIKIGDQINEAINIWNTSHLFSAEELLTLVKIKTPELALNKYPHEMSGGQKQRVMIAIALACNPSFLIADEPTTALDATVQREVIDLLKEIIEERNLSMLFISHDLALVAQVSDEIMVMHKGRVVEKGTRDEVYKTPKETYTKTLLESRIDISDPKSDSVSSADTLLKVEGLNVSYGKKKLFGGNNRTQVLHDLSFEMKTDSTLGVVGESGCGKTTLGKVLVGLVNKDSGKVIYKGNQILENESDISHRDSRIQMIFQDPFGSLNPKMTIGSAILEVVLFHRKGTGKEKAKQEVEELLVNVGLYKEDFYKYPHEFSGGQRQRISIARTVAAQPELIICDESVSALDVSIQGVVLSLLNELKSKYGFSYLFISHDLAVVRHFCDEIIVLDSGKIVESGPAVQLCQNPSSEYTQKLLAAVPSI